MQPHSNQFKKVSFLEPNFFFKLQVLRSFRIKNILERIASIFNVEKSASGDPASAGGCRLSHQSEIFMQSAATCSRWFPFRGFFYPEDGGEYVPPERRLTQDLQSAISQKTTFFIVSAVKTSNLT
jgi:hypothetical protein